MRDLRDPQELGTAILALKARLGCSILEAADAEGEITKLPTTLCALPAKIQPAPPAPDATPQGDENGQRNPT